MGLLKDPESVGADDITAAMQEAHRMRARAHGLEEDKGPDWRPPGAAPMERILALDLSSRTGWAFYENRVLKEWGILEADGSVLKAMDPNVKYPWSLMAAVLGMKEKVRRLVEKYGPDIVLIEETNIAKARYSQKFLEWLHFNVVAYLHVMGTQCGWPKSENVIYISTMDWRKTLDIKMTKADSKQNRKVNEIKNDTALSKELKAKLMKQLGVRGKINKKHLSCRYVEDTYKMKLKVSTENDIADAICIGDAFIKGAAHCTGYEPSK